MRLLAYALLALALVAAPAAATDLSTDSAKRGGCAEAVRPQAAAPAYQLAQSSCRSDCRSQRGYCVSTCRDSQCRAICNDVYQSCVSRCR